MYTMPECGKQTPRTNGNEGKEEEIDMAKKKKCVHCKKRYVHYLMDDTCSVCATRGALTWADKYGRGY